MSISSSVCEPPPVYRLRPSRSLRLILLGVPALALGALLTTAALPPVVAMVGALLAGVLAVIALRRHWPGAGQAVSVFRIEPGGRCRMRLANGAELVARIDDRLVLPWLVILSLRAGRQRRALVVAGDALDAEALRRLRREAKSC